MVLCILISPSQDQEDKSEDAQPRHVTFNMESSLQSEYQQIITDNTVSEFLRLHYKYGHLSFKRLRRMEKLGIIPKKLEKCDTPTCMVCMYAKYTCKPWSGRSIKTPPKPLQVTNPGHIVLVDQLVTPTPGLVEYMTGIPTTKIFKYATVFVDHLSRYSYIHLQQTASAEETLEG